MAVATPTGQSQGTGNCSDPNDICTCCGAVGSAAYASCQAQLAINHAPPACAQAAYQQAIANNPATNAFANLLPAAIAQAIQSAIVIPLEQNLPGILERVGLFLFALVLVIAGIYTLSK